MSIKLGINGYGRIGRLVHRALLAQHAPVEIVAINDITDAQTNAFLLKYDSIHRKFNGEVRAEDKAIIVNGKKIEVFAEKDPANLPWGKLGVDIVLESTGKFTSKVDAGKHISAGAKKVFISAPAKEKDVPTFVIGVNEKNYKKAEHHIISIGSCTTNCLAPIAKVINDNFKIVTGFMNTIHSYTNDQRILDQPHKDLRRARAAALSMIPTSTGAAKALALVIPELAGKMDGLSLRVPTPNGSIVDMTCLVEKEITKELVNAAFKAAADGPMKGILEYTEEPIVSADIIGNPHSSILDAQLTHVLGKTLKVMSWYDNEWGFSCRCAQMILMMI